MLARTRLRPLMASSSCPITDTMPSDEDVEEDDEDKDTQTNCYDCGRESDSIDKEQENQEAVDDLAKQDDRNNGVETDVLYADTVQPEVHVAEAGPTRAEGGDNQNGEQRDGNDNDEGDRSKHEKPEGDEAEHEVRKRDEPEGDEHEGGEGGQEDAQHEVVDKIVEGEYEKDEHDVETAHVERR